MTRKEYYDGSNAYKTLVARGASGSGRSADLDGLYIAIQAAHAGPSLALIGGSDYGGADLTPANGDVLSGTFTNVGTLNIAAGVTVFVQPGTALSITAANIIIDGTLDGSGAGFAGGAPVPYTGGSCPSGLPGNSGAGPGGGGAGLFGCNIHGSGGGGGGYGGVGGRSGSFFSSSNPGQAAAGAAYGDAVSPSVAKGSGGGSGAKYTCCFLPGASGAGGAGGAAISLFGTINLNGSILADGANGKSAIQSASCCPSSFDGNPAGGGGSGGGVLLNGILSLDGLISATGGSGGNGSGSTPRYGSGGGGGAGGRVKLFGPAQFGLSFQSNVSGGAAGASSSGSTILATAGAPGTFSDQTSPFVTEVGFDVKPTSCRNPLNVKSKGVLPAAITGSSSLDVTDIDPSTVQLEGVSAKRWAMEDVVADYTPYIGKQNATDCTTDGSDGNMDLTLKFDRQAVVAALGVVSDGDVLVLQLTGKLKDGTPIVGEDVGVILKKGKN